MQAVQDTGNQMEMTKLNFQEMAMLLLILFEPHPGILGSHIYLCHTSLDVF